MKRENRAFLFGAILVTVLSSLVMCSCETVKRTQRRDDKAVSRVLSKEELLTKVAKHINAGGDTVRITTEKVTYDTVLVPHVIHPQTCDECERYVNSLVFAITEPIDTIFANGIRLTISGDGIIVSNTIKTNEVKIRDRRAEQRLRDSVDAWKDRDFIVNAQLLKEREENDRLRKIISQLEKNIEYVKKKIGWPWWVWYVLGIASGALVTASLLRKLFPLLLIKKIVELIVNLLRKKERK